MNTWCISVGKIAIFADPITLFNRDVAFAGPEHFAELSATTGVSSAGLYAIHLSFRDVEENLESETPHEIRRNRRAAGRQACRPDSLVASAA